MSEMNLNDWFGYTMRLYYRLKHYKATNFISFIWLIQFGSPKLVAEQKAVWRHGWNITDIYWWLHSPAIVHMLIPRYTDWTEQTVNPTVIFPAAFMSGKLSTESEVLF